MNKKGFTLVELLVAMSIMGLLMIMAFPTMRAVQLNNQKKIFESYGDSVLSVAKLYVDSYSNDLFDPEIKNQSKIVYLSDIQKKGLIKDININETSCINGESNVLVVKYNNDYSYCLHLKCTNKNNNKELYNVENTKGSCGTVSKSDVIYKYKTHTKIYEVIDGDESYRLLSPVEVGFENIFKTDQVKFEKWDKGNIGEEITINGNTTITPQIHKYSYTIKYEKSNNSITNSTDETNCTCGSDCILENNGYKYTGYTFFKWHRNSNNELYDEGENVKDTIGKSITSDNEVVTLTTKFRINKIFVKYNANSGIFATNYDSDYSIDTDEQILYKDSPIIQQFNYNEMLGTNGLNNWNNPNAINLTKNKHKAKLGEEWITVDNSKTFNQNIEYNANNLCNADNGDCYVDLKVNWVLDTRQVRARLSALISRDHQFYPKIDNQEVVDKTIGSTVNFSIPGIPDWTYLGTMIRKVSDNSIYLDLDSSVRSFKMPDFDVYISPKYKRNTRILVSKGNPADVNVFHHDTNSSNCGGNCLSADTTPHFTWSPDNYHAIQAKNPHNKEDNHTIYDYYRGQSRTIGNVSDFYQYCKLTFVTQGESWNYRNNAFRHFWFGALSENDKYTFLHQSGPSSYSQFQDVHVTYHDNQVFSMYLDIAKSYNNGNPRNYYVAYEYYTHNTCSSINIYRVELEGCTFEQ